MNKKENPLEATEKDEAPPPMSAAKRALALSTSPKGIVLATGVILLAMGVAAVIVAPHFSPEQTTTASSSNDSTRPSTTVTPKSRTESATKTPPPKVESPAPATETQTDGSGTTPNKAPTSKTPVAPAAPPAPPVVVVPPPPPPVVEPPAPPPVDHTPRISHNENYRPGCGDMGFMSSHEPGEGGTSIITVGYKYDVTTYSTPTGFGVKVYACVNQD